QSLSRHSGHSFWNFPRRRIKVGMETRRDDQGRKAGKRKREGRGSRNGRDELKRVEQRRRVSTRAWKG
ncbi:hypothetical protein RUM43_006397, partial [Polyplax serrata]